MQFALTCQRLFRKKNMPTGDMSTRLKRCLTTFDITLIAVGHMIGAGVYVLTGSVVRNQTGPSIVLSFLLAGIASFLSALCYSEFGARVPKAGSAYSYTYVSLGEIWAFIIGWNIILEHVVGSAAVARSWSGYLDSLVGHQISNVTLERVGHLREHSSNLFGDYPDILAFLVVLVVGVFVALGSRTSTNLNTIFTVVNLGVILVVVVFGFMYADFSLWSGVDANGASNFFPYGVSGMLAGAASCFFAYIGFDGLATAGEEAKNPETAIPLATFISMSVVTFAYILMSAALTLMIPYYKVNPTAAFSDAFAQKGAWFANIAVSVGALCGMTTSLVGGMFALPRCVYAMAEDGLLFETLAHVSSTQVPINAIVVFGSLTAVTALLFDISTLVEFLSIGTLMAYSIVSASVIVLRYQPAKLPESDTWDNGGKLRCSLPFKEYLEWEPGQSIYCSITAIICSFAVISFSISSGFSQTSFGFFIVSLASIVALLVFIFICLHYQNSVQLSFKVPFVPFIPCLSLFINILMMTHLAPLTWVRLVVWMTIGFLIYFLYAIKHSKEELGNAEKISRSNTYDSVVTASTLQDE